MINVHLVHEEPEADPSLDAARELFAPAYAPDAPRERVVVKRVLPDREILHAMNAIGAILLVRVVLAIAVLGAVYLCWTAFPNPSQSAIWMLAVYGATVMAPLVWLSTQRV
jgi:hypothetical protein